MCGMNEWQDGRGMGGECMGGKGPGEMEEGPECAGRSQPRGLCPPPLEPFSPTETSEETQQSLPSIVSWWPWVELLVGESEG